MRDYGHRAPLTAALCAGTVAWDHFDTVQANACRDLQWLEYLLFKVLPVAEAGTFSTTSPMSEKITFW